VTFSFPPFKFLINSIHFFDMQLACQIIKEKYKILYLLLLLPVICKIPVFAKLTIEDFYGIIL